MMRRFALLCVLAALVASCTSAPRAQQPTSIPSTVSAPATIPTRTSEPTPAGTPIPAIASGTVVIEAGDHFFSPSQLTVVVGTAVVWRIVGQNAHDITASDGSFASSALNFGSTFTYTFNKPGTYPYVCTLHAGDGMFAELVVVAP